MLQLLYISSAAPAHPVNLEALLAQSRANNRRDAITGMLYTDGRRFLQVLEGEAGVVEAAMDRIQADPRHRAVVLLSRRDVETREFGEWAMAHQPGGGSDAFSARIETLSRNAHPNVAATIRGLVETRRAA